MSRIDELFKSNKILQELCNKTYKTEYKNRSDRMKRGIVSNKILEINSVSDLIKQDIIKDIINESDKGILKTYKTYNSIGSIHDLTPFVTRVITEHLNIKLSIGDIKMIKESIISLFNNQLNESSESLSESLLENLFFRWVAKPILESNKTEIELDEIEIPTGIKLLLKDNFNNYLIEYNSLSLNQLYRRIDEAINSNIMGLGRGYLIDTFYNMISIANSYYDELDYDIRRIDTVISSTPTRLVDYLVDNTDDSNKDESFENSNYVYNFIKQSESQNNKMLSDLVKKHKNQYINMMLELFSDFKGLISYYNLDDKMENWHKDKRVIQAFVSIVGDILLANTKGKKSIDLYESNLTTNLITVLSILDRQYYTEFKKNTILDIIDELYKMNDLEDRWNNLSDSQIEQIEELYNDKVTLDEVKYMIKWFKTEIPKLMSSNKGITISAMSKIQGPYMITFYLIPYSLVQRFNSNIEYNKEEVEKLKSVQGHKISKEQADRIKNEFFHDEPSGSMDDGKTKPGR